MNTPTPPLHYGSVCSGIEAVSLAWQPLGMVPAWFSEIDAFANAVLAHRHPQVRNLGDMTQIAPRVRDHTVAAPDLLVGGTPCQSFSVAGMRLGLADPRGALTLTYAELANAIDHTRQQDKQPPVVIVWENVPGVLSDRSNGFGCFLGALAGERRELQPTGNRWSHAGCVYGPQRRIAWRVLDAQYFGVAQRRKRVFVIASARRDVDPTAILFEPGGLPGDPAPRQEAWEIPAVATAAGPAGASGWAGCMSPPDGAAWGTACFGGGNTQGPIERAACLTARGHKCDFDVETFAVQSVTGCISHALSTANSGKGCSEDGSGRGVPVVATRPTRRAVAFAQNDRGEVRLESGHGQIAGTLSSGGGTPGQGFPTIASVPIGGRDADAIFKRGEDLPPTLRASSRGGDMGHVPVSSYEAHFQYTAASRDDGSTDWSAWQVRRLMPLECERLQGLPDNYTLVPYRGKPAADAPRYKAIGNAMAVPCVAWIGQRLLRALR